MFFQRTKSVANGKYRAKSNIVSYNGKALETITRYSGTLFYYNYNDKEYYRKNVIDLRKKSL